MNKIKYERLRDAALQMQIDFKINELPVRITDILKALEIPVISYRQNIDILRKLGLNKLAETSDAFTIKKNGAYTIFYDDTKSPKRIRFTLAHELGHVACGHIKEGGVTMRNTEPSDNDPEIETEANKFAIRLLAPACVLHELKLFTAKKISDACNISIKSAEYRLKRLMVLEERNERFLITKGYGCFYMNPLERQVHKQFEDYINRNRS